MSKAAIKSAEQILFDRVMVTWIYPELQKRVDQGLISPPILLTQALILCKNGKTEKVLINEEVKGSVIQVIVVHVQPIAAGEPVLFSNIGGLRSIKVKEELRGYSYAYFVLGKDERYFLISKKMASVVGNKEFDRLHEVLRMQGTKPSPAESEQTVYFDFTRNWMNFSLSAKRRAKKELIRSTLEFMRTNVNDRVERKLRLPVIFIHPDEQFLLLLMEVRDTYVDGHFFSCIASSATTADSMCNALTERYGRSAKLRRWFLKETLGNKIPKLRAEGIITKDQEGTLTKINNIRNRHIHPRRKLSKVTMKT